MESIGNYRAGITIDRNKNYSIRRQNIYLDRQSGVENISTAQGKISDKDYTALKELIVQSRLFSMNDAYGFDETKDHSNTSALENILYQITYSNGRRSKSITIRPNSGNAYPQKFPELISFLSRYISEHIK
jgi:hypothetical protein